MQEPEATARAWADRWTFSFPVLLDADGKVAESYAPADVLPDLPRSQVPIAANLIIDAEGRIHFYSLLDSMNFDARLVALRARLDELLAARDSTRGGSPAAVTLEPPAPVEVRPGETTAVRLRFQVADGYRVQANPASETFLVPFALQIQASAGIRPRSVRYPAGQPYRLAGTERDLSVYGGIIDLTVELTADETAPAAGALEGVLRYQACNDRVCLRPSSLSVTLPFRRTRPGGRSSG